MASQSDEAEPNARELQDDLIKDALARGRSYKEAAEHVGVSARTIRRRMADAGFRSSVLSLTSERNRQISSLMAEESIGAIQRLIVLTHDYDPRVALRAIQILLSNASRVRREVELHERIAALEARLLADSEAGDAS